MKYSVLLYLSLAACLFTGCYEDEPQEEAREVQRITFDTVKDRGDKEWISTRSVTDYTVRKDTVVSSSGHAMNLTVTESPMPDDTGYRPQPMTRGSLVTPVTMSTFGVSAAVYRTGEAYTSAGHGSYFYCYGVVPGIATDYLWPTEDYMLSFFAYHPYNNDSFTVLSEASDAGSPVYSYTVPSALADQVDVMTAETLDQAGGVFQPVNLTFSHHCTAVKVLFTNERPVPVTVTSVSVIGVKHTGTLQGGSWTLDDEVTTFTHECDVTVEASATESLTGDGYFLMLPQELPEGAKLRVETTDDVYEGDITETWEENRMMTYRFSLSGVTNYLRFIADEAGTFTLTIPAGITASHLKSVSYSLDGGETWVTTNNSSSAVTITTPTIAAGDSVMWKGSGNKMSSNSGSNKSCFSSTGRFYAKGNIMSLLFAESHEYINSLDDSGNVNFSNNNKNAFGSLFKGCSKLLSAPELPATTLAENCYFEMFYNCTALTTPPELPATTLAQYCYYEMFYNCRSLTAAPELPATTVQASSYRYMFYGCTALTTAPELPATTVNDNSYGYMFSGCTALTTPPTAINAVAAQCCQHMFDGCTALTSTPELPVTTMQKECYLYMFKGCNKLTAAPELPATTLAQGCYRSIFVNCSRLTTAPELPATTLAQNCYESMFTNCTALTTPPVLPATTLASYCYAYMLEGCTALTTPPVLPATTLANYCCTYMFSGCKNLTAAPELPATTLAQGCYQQMFRSCTKLRYIKAAFTSIATGSCENWVTGVSSTGTFVKNAAATWDVTGANGIPSGWTVETYTPE